MEEQLEFRNEETDKVNLYESKIKNIVFDHDASKIEVIVDWTEGDDIKIIFEDCQNLMIDLKHNLSLEENLLGVLEISGFSYKRLNRGYIVQFNFDFNLTGMIRFTCQNFTFCTPSIPIQNGGNDNLIN